MPSSTRSINTATTPIQKKILKGHRAPIQCLAHQKSTSLLLSGSADKTARLWDLRDDDTRCRASSCFLLPDEVTSVSFAPLSPSGRDSARNTVYLSTPTRIYLYDVRMAGAGPVIVRTPAREYGCLTHRDDISQIGVAAVPSSCRRQGGVVVGGDRDEDGDRGRDDDRRAVIVAAGDDAGDVQYVIEEENDGCDDGRGGGAVRRQGVLKHVDENEVGMVTSIAFRREDDDGVYGSCDGSDGCVLLASGGTDCVIKLWDVMREETLFSHHVSSESNYNPPMVHSLSWSRSGALLAAGLGDGSILILNEDLEMVSRLRDGHDATAACVDFPHWEDGGAGRCIVSAGNDGAVLVWDLGEYDDDAARDGVCSPVNLFGEGLVEEMDDVAGRERILFGIPHGEKPNWLVCSGGSEEAMPFHVFVADTTCDITAYLIPQR